ncbi:hypothetical protein KIPB_015822, partial [Kipferlia bialata]
SVPDRVAGSDEASFHSNGTPDYYGDDDFEDDSFESYGSPSPERVGQPMQREASIVLAGESGIGESVLGDAFLPGFSVGGGMTPEEIEARRLRWERALGTCGSDKPALIFSQAPLCPHDPKHPDATPTLD